MSIKENLQSIKSELPAQVTLVAVSKTKPLELIQEAYDAGLRDFGENYAQELAEKETLLPKDIRWHAIGHLQTNKVKYIAPFVHLIHAVDSSKLLEEIDKQARKNKRVIDCLLQIYIAREETKFGFSFEECEGYLQTEDFKKLEHIKITGLMGMATNTSDDKQIRNEFRSLKEFFEKLTTINFETSNFKLQTLSMGMSSDYKIAIEEGSTLVRIGSSIFGERNYTK
ncbi:MAG TPA: YggS family pyridoxal phosphate-dependent enzyme [Bacteroidia bacterium]|jgi:pyridoxal phosphate enzyme (YggS family)|nr:YggS family pyridoxal phosphate-dependent enzyme [Bacteroidia bacterium]